SRQQWFSVVDRNSTFACKGGAVDIRKLACDVGARYVLEGSVRKAGGRIRVTAQLIDATKRIHVWADRYDSAAADIFRRQDDIINRIVDSVRSQLVMAEAMRLRGRRSGDVDAPDTMRQAIGGRRLSRPDHAGASAFVAHERKRAAHCAEIVAASHHA